MEEQCKKEICGCSPEKNSLQSAYSTLIKQSQVRQTKLAEPNLKIDNKSGETDVITYYLNSILSHMAQGLLFVNLEGYITTCNKAAESLLGLNMFQILFHKYAAHFSDEFFGFSMAQAIKTRMAPPKAIATIHTSEGIKCRLEIDTSIIIHDVSSQNSDELQGIILLMRDVTEMHRLHEEASRRDRFQALGEMASMMAHEVRNPLGSIKGFASLLIRDLRDQPAMQQMARSIEEGADNLSRLVTNILNYSRPLSPNLVMTDLQGLIRSLCRNIEVDESVDKRIELSFHSSLSSLSVPLDEALLKSAILNLLKNAIQAMPQGGMISISLEKENALAVIRISDQGVGIASENLKKLFNPFFTTKPQGNGFGLAEVQRVIQAHNGLIDVESTLGKGTIFTIKLPLNL